MVISETDEFKRDFKLLVKKHKTLEQDYAVLIQAIQTEPKGDGTKHWNLLHQTNEFYVFKIRMVCRSTRSFDFRVIYMYNGTALELLFIEIYYKGTKQNEDKKRIEKYMKSNTAR